MTEQRMTLEERVRTIEEAIARLERRVVHLADVVDAQGERFELFITTGELWGAEQKDAS